MPMRTVRCTEIIVVNFTIHYIGVGRSKAGTKSPDFERDVCDLSENHGGTHWVAKLLESIFDHWSRGAVQEIMLFMRRIGG